MHNRVQEHEGRRNGGGYPVMRRDVDDGAGDLGACIHHDDVAGTVRAFSEVQEL